MVESSAMIEASQKAASPVYGGDHGTAMRQEFPAVDESLDSPEGSASYADNTGDKAAERAHNQMKIDQILAACYTKDLQALAALAASEEGLVNGHLRALAWPILLGVDSSHDQTTIGQTNWSELPRHSDEDQVQLDVNRSFVYYPANQSERRREERKHELSRVIKQVLRTHPMLCYFQGYHDIVQVILLVLGADSAAPAVARLSLLRIRDFMLPTLSAAEIHLQLLPAILYIADPELCQHLSGATSPKPFFALAATLTLYAHDIEEYGDISRLFDYLLASDAAVPVYLFATIVMSRKKELLAIPDDEPEMLHSTLSKLPKPLDLEGLIHRTQTLYKQHPPERLPFRAWRQVSSHSVLKTTRDPHTLAKQTLQQGEQLFKKQAAEVRRQDALNNIRQRIKILAYRYRRPVMWTGTAILVGFIGLYFQRAGATASIRTYSSLLGRIRDTALENMKKLAR